MPLYAVRKNVLRGPKGLGRRDPRINYPHWPPKDSSPSHPIEPWGKKFMVTNLARHADLSNWEGPRGFWEQPPPNLGADGKPLLNTPVLVIADPYNRPKTFLTRQDFDTLMDNVEFLKAELKKHQRVINKQSKDRRWHLQYLLLPRRSYKMQGRAMPSVLSKATPRPPKT
eukprot:GDKH01012388.1.p1 GENE.GDKH01012388.1~~GDKH01012388.1.p1  ORF type:complete len:170 (+),score=0.81 GDKH01012388.1:163-672(+)